MSDGYKTQQRRLQALRGQFSASQIGKQLP